MARTHAGWHLHWLDITSAGGLSQGHTPLSTLPTPGGGCRSHLQLLTDEFCILCHRISAILLSVLWSNVQPEDFIEGLRERLRLGRVKLSWNRILSATLIYMLLSLTVRRAQDAQRILCDLRDKVIEVKHQPEGAGFHLLWLLITDVESCKIDNPRLVWILTRALWIMPQLRPSTLCRLDQFFHSVLSGYSNDVHRGVYSSDKCGVGPIAFSSLELEIRRELL